MIYFCIFVLVVSAGRLVLDANTQHFNDPFRAFLDVVIILLAIEAIWVLA